MFENIFGKKDKRMVPVRGARAAFMNVAFAIIPTIVGTWTADPVGLANLTDEQHLTHLTTDGVTNTTLANKVQIKVDLGQIFELYRIDVLNIAATGIKANNAANAGTVKLQVSTDNSAWTTLATQTPAGTAFEDMAIDYDGEGVAARYVRLYLENDDTYFLTIDISDIEAYGS